MNFDKLYVWAFGTVILFAAEGQRWNSITKNTMNSINRDLIPQEESL